ncbi:MAG: hypothetical protein EXR07_15380 [Acetobacteraceae bacterium]|nr:hypothetical protein [Acetobacteraceae bacterium]
MSGLIKRSFSLVGHRTSVALEREFWDALLAMAAARGGSLASLVASVDGARDGAIPLASALRVLALGDALGRATRAGLSVSAQTDGNEPGGG